MLRLTKRTLVVPAVLIALFAAVTTYVTVPSLLELREARSAVTVPVQHLTNERGRRARLQVGNALRRLDSTAGDLLERVPLVGAHIRAMEDVAEAALPTLDAGLKLLAQIDAVRARLLDLGRVRLEALSSLGPSLATEVSALANLRRQVAAHLKDGLIPNARSALEGVDGRAQEMQITGEKARRLVEIAAPILGSKGKRTYLLLMLNNAELRGGGGILSGLGTLEVDNGRFRLGRLHYYGDLADNGSRRVPAPREYRRRFGTYKADTTLLINTAFSPDFVDVAVVASRLFRLLTGTKTDGVLGLDPRGVAALLARDATVRAPRGGRWLSRDQLPKYVYSDAYRGYRYHPGHQAQRRAGILEIGRQAFRSFLTRGLSDRESLERAASAFAGGHLRFVSFNPRELRVLNDLGATGDLAPVRGDSLLVTAHNFARTGIFGSKMDYWARRIVRHRCEIESRGRDSCETRVTLRNEAPQGLNLYVAGRPYALLRNYVEMYVPRQARLTGVNHDGRAVEFRQQFQAGRRVIGIYVEVPRGSHTTLDVRYELKRRPGQPYSLVAIPQPLSRDAKLDIQLELPTGWSVEGPGEADGDVWRFSEPWDCTVEIRASAAD